MNTEDKIAKYVAIEDRIIYGIYTLRERYITPRRIYIGRMDYDDLRKTYEPYLFPCIKVGKTKTYMGLEMIIVDKDYHLEVI